MAANGLKGRIPSSSLAAPGPGKTSENDEPLAPRQTESCHINQPFGGYAAPYKGGDVLVRKRGQTRPTEIWEARMVPDKM